MNPFTNTVGGMGKKRARHNSKASKLSPDKKKKRQNTIKMLMNITNEANEVQAVTDDGRKSDSQKDSLSMKQCDGDKRAGAEVHESTAQGIL